MNWLTRIRELRSRGVLGMNRRNTQCILDLNPRSSFPNVDGKRRLHDLCRRLDLPTPSIHAVLLVPSALRHLPRLLGPLNDFVIKPNRGAAGRGIMVITGRDEDVFVRHNNERVTLEEIRQHVSGILSGLFSLGGQSDEALIQQRIVPHPALAAISYQGTPDIRVIVYKGSPAAAMLRLPTRLSGGRANLHQGAIGAGIDLATGITCRAVINDRTTRNHPDTGAGVVGFLVPYWSEILDMSRKVGAAVGLGYVGVDIVLDRNQGPLLLEANARPGLAIQIANGCGLLARFEEIDRGGP